MEHRHDRSTVAGQTIAPTPTAIRDRPWFARYGGAFVLTLVAWGVAIALGNGLSVRTHLPFAAAVAVATWVGGAGPRLLGAAPSLPAPHFCFLPPLCRPEPAHFGGRV